MPCAPQTSVLGKDLGLLDLARIRPDHMGVAGILLPEAHQKHHVFCAGAERQVDYS